MNKVIFGLIALVISATASAHTGYCNNQEYRSGNCGVISTSHKVASDLCPIDSVVVLVRADVGGGKVVPVGYACESL